MRRAAALAAALALAALPNIVLGHAELVSSDPPAGGTLTTTPYTLKATFDDELAGDGSSIVVLNASGTQVAIGTVSADDAHTMTAELAALSDGEYTVRWTAVSADDAAIERGQYSFTVGAAAASTTPPTQAPGSGAPGSNDVLLAIGLAAILIVVVFVVLRGRR